MKVDRINALIIPKNMYIQKTEWKLRPWRTETGGIRAFGPARIRRFTPPQAGVREAIRSPNPLVDSSQVK